MWYLVFSTFACLIGVAIITWLHNQHQMDVVVAPGQPPGDGPLISVIVPARNEERNIRRCVEALLAQTYPNFEVLVLDDRSTDATAEILAEIAARDTRLQVHSGSELPAGWAGKPHALTQAAALAHGEWLCFVDADTFVAPQVLSSVYSKAEQFHADLFTILTAQELGSFWEKVILPLVFTALSVGFAPRKVNDPQRKDAIANGQFIFIRREIYSSIGGHAAIRNSIVEDKDLAVLVKGSGHRLVIADGRQVASTRMYTSLIEMWEGWTKNIFLGLKGSPAMLLMGAFGATLSLMAALALPAWMLGGFIWWLLGGALQALLVMLEGVALWGYLVFWRVLAARSMGISAWYALTTPLGAAVFAAMMFSSAFKVISGRGVTWKGRKYSPADVT